MHFTTSHLSVFSSQLVLVSLLVLLYCDPLARCVGHMVGDDDTLYVPDTTCVYYY